MVRLSKYCLSLFVVASLICCKQSVEKHLPETNRELAERIFEEGSHIGYGQGSPEVMSQIEKALTADSTYAEAWRELSVAYLKRGMPHKWKPLFDKAVHFDAETWQPWRGYLYLWFYRDYKKAIADFNASDTLTPYIDHPQGHSVDYWRGIAYLGIKDYNNSIAYFNKHIKKETEESGEDWVELEAFLYLGIAHMESGAMEMALENFNKVIDYFGNSADAKYFKAKIFFEKGEYEKASMCVQKAMDDFNKGYFNQRPYVETLYQIYTDDLIELEQSILQIK